MARPAPFGGRPFGSRPFSGPFGNHRPFHPRRSIFFGNPFFLPAYGAPYGWYPPDDYPPADDYQEAEAPPEQPGQPGEQDSALAGQVERLTEEVQILRGAQAASGGPGPGEAAAQASTEKPTPAVLVYRDGRRREIENYAVMGGAVWVFAGQTTRKIALADLDLNATRRLNDERGVDFIPTRND